MRYYRMSKKTEFADEDKKEFKAKCAKGEVLAFT